MGKINFNSAIVKYFFVAFILVFFGNSNAVSDVIKDKVTEIVQDFERHLQNENREKYYVVIRDFPDRDTKEKKKLSKEIASTCTSVILERFRDKKNMIVLDRENIEAIEKEVFIETNEIHFEQDKWKEKLGKKLGTGCLITGTIVKLSKSIKIDAQMIDIVSGATLASSDESIRLDEIDKAYIDDYQEISKGLAFHVNYIYRAAGKGSPKPIRKGDVLRSGDRYKIIFTPEKDCYVYIFQVDSLEQVFALFPMENSENPVKKGLTYYAPGTSKSFRLDKNTGIEKIYFIASKAKNTELEDLSKKLDDLRIKQDHKQADKIQNEIKQHFRSTRGNRGVDSVVSDDEESASWDGDNSSSLASSVLSQIIESYSDSSKVMSVLEFVHE
ncbi:MAG: DUF4384 domain-containing protein [Desulfobacterales bacterium]|nr:DUF4384 domain-containing protein [Desulfobacterales bacterium]